jgi:hypothetical protein
MEVFFLFYSIRMIFKKINLIFYSFIIYILKKIISYKIKIKICPAQKLCKSKKRL